MKREFKNNKSATETTRKNCNVYGQALITNRQVRNWFSKFLFDDTSLRDEPRPGGSSGKLVKSDLNKELEN